jgi:hypothetical protein
MGTLSSRLSHVVTDTGDTQNCLDQHAICSNRQRNPDSKMDSTDAGPGPESSCIRVRVLRVMLKSRSVRYRAQYSTPGIRVVAAVSQRTTQA